MNIWLDDERSAPANWVHVKTIGVVIYYLKKGEVENLSLDHDLGENTETGYKLCLWMAENGIWPKNRPQVHSQNPVGRQNMLAIINRYFQHKA